MEQQMPSARTEVTETAARARAIRSRLPGQMLRERLEMAALLYGPLYTLTEIRQRIAETLTRRAGFVRGAAIEPIESYREPIPEAALFKYDDAVQSGLFSRFAVGTPMYYRQHQTDPWIIGEVTGETDRWAVIAQWDA
jgi:hypothetical protein